MTKTLFLLVTVSSSIASANPRVAALEPQPDGSPGDTAPIATASTLPSTYVSLGGAIGGAVDWLYGGTQVEGGYRLTDTLWVRGRLDRAARMGYGLAGFAGLVRLSRVSAHRTA